MWNAIPPATALTPGIVVGVANDPVRPEPLVSALQVPQQPTVALAPVP